MRQRAQDWLFSPGTSNTPSDQNASWTILDAFPEGSLENRIPASLKNTYRQPNPERPDVAIRRDQLGRSDSADGDDSAYHK